MKIIGSIRRCSLIGLLFFLIHYTSVASADSLLNLIQKHISDEHVQHSLLYADRALVHFMESEDWSSHRKVLKLVKRIPFSIENEQLITAFYEKAANRLAHDYERESANTWSYLGDYFAYYYLFEKAIPYYEKAASELKLLNDTIDLHFIYYQLGQALIEGHSDGVQANAYADAAIRVYKKKKRQSRKFHGRLLGLKGWAYRAIDENKALDYFYQAIEATGDRSGRYREHICRILINQQRFTEALEKAEALDESSTGNPEKHALMAQALTGLAQYNKAIDELQKAKKIYESWGDINHPSYAKLFYFEAIVWQNDGQLQKCVASCQKVYQLTIPDYSSDNALSFPTVEYGALSLWAYNALLVHGKALRKLFQVNQDKVYLVAAVNLFERVLDEIESRRWQMLNAMSKEAFNKFVYGSYDEALLAHATLMTIDQGLEMKNKFLNLYDRSKSTLFRETVLSKAISKNTLSSKERRIQDSLQTNISSLLVERAKLRNIEDNKIETDRLNKRLFDFQEALKVFADERFGSDAKSNLLSSSLTQDQLREAMGENTATLAYHMTEHEIIQVFLSSSDLQISTIVLTQDLRQSFSTLERGLTDWDLILDSASVSQQLIQQHSLFISNQLFGNIIVPDQIEHVIVVPDRDLHHIPFELLSLHSEKLGDKYQIFYAHALNTILTANSTDHHEFKYNFGGFAPSYDEDCRQIMKVAHLQDNNVNGNVLRSSFEDLPEARENVDFIAKLLRGKAWLGDYATKTRFLKTMDSYSILHLGMHGQLDTVSNELNSLVFGCGPNNLLHLGEIQTINLSTDLVVLSACNTGLGKHAEGEGPMSLSKSFFYAGAKSTLMSLWPVPDRQTAIIMRYFYQNLAEGMRKSAALQKAKKDYLVNASSLERHPAFWSGFVLFGDDAVIEFNQGLNFVQLVMLGLVVVLLCVIAYYYFRRRKISPHP